MKLKKGTKKLTLFRFLLAKLLYENEGEGLHMDEFTVLVNLYYDLLEIDDPSFFKKYHKSLLGLSVFFSELGRVKYFPVRFTLVEKPYSDLYQWFGPLLPSQNSYFGLRGNRDLRKSFYISFNDTLRPQRFPPQRFVGVGYRDKGTCQDIAFDGSPSWKEIGSVAAQFEETVEETFPFISLDFLEEVMKSQSSRRSKAEE